MAVTQIDANRQVQDLSVTNAKLAGSIALSKLATTVIQANGGQAFTADQSLGGFKLTNVGTPTAATDAANKAYVDAAAAGIDWKASVRAATTAPGALTTAFANGQAIDGVTLATGDRILVKDQATASENGIYTVNASGSPTRALDADSNAEVTSGMAVFVEEGTVNDNTGWILTNNGAITLGTTGLSFTQFTGLGNVTAGAGLTKSGNTLDVGGTTNRIVVNADTIDIGSDVVTLTGTQTLTNKSISGGQITSAVANATNATNATTATTATNVAGGVIGSLPYQSNTGATALLAPNTSTARQFLVSQGNGTTGQAPSLSALQASDIPTLNQNTTGTASNVTGTVAIANGGTGQTTKGAAFDALSPMTTAGDLIVGGASGTGTRLAAGTSAGQVLTSNGSGAAPSWQAPAAAPIFVTRETPTGSVNGSNVTFTLANTPTAGSEEVFLNGILQEPGAGNDYTISGATITYLSAPLTGDRIRVNYRR